MAKTIKDIMCNSRKPSISYKSEMLQSATNEPYSWCLGHFVIDDHKRPRCLYIVKGMTSKILAYVPVYD